MLRRPASALVAALLVGPVLTALTACGAGNNGQLQVTVSSPDAGTPTAPYSAADPATWAVYKPGDDATLVVTVVNTGPGSAAGVTVHVVLPQTFHYRATTLVKSAAAARTQVLDAAVNTNAPIFGLWTISPPGTAGIDLPSEVQITFTASVQGNPGNAAVQAFAVGDTSTGQVNAAPYNVSVSAAAKLSALVSATPTTVARGSTVTYEVRVTNSGTGNADDVGILVTLPPVMAFASSVTPFAGNGSRGSGVNPIKNTLVVYYDGFVLPPVSSAGPGYVVIVFKASVLGGSGSASPSSGVPPGTYTVDVQLTDAAGDVVALHSIAPVNVT